ncbi:OLC1v1011181C2 [Oldenlandia corymbosa var. corymbosa]|uniref:OLC1v1011181C2 n=1 Tax=Oldenlandia corymbosa var. corymbosa TaxID=529605 RepID=A0AAV1DUS6_OLDCO|nr:OLC1v1011181C2 [Oldenlandia corymbosa var. corymbosa]
MSQSLMMEEVNAREMNGHYVPHKEIFAETSPRSPLSTHSPDTDSIDLAMEGAVDTSIEQLYNNVCDMQSSDQSPSRVSYLSYGEESRIDSELRYLAAGDYEEEEIKKEMVMERKEAGDSGSEEDTGFKDDNFAKINGIAAEKPLTPVKAKKASKSEAPTKKGSKGKSFNGIPRIGKGSKKLNGISSAKVEKNSPLAGVKDQNGAEDASDAAYLAPYILKQARDLISSGENFQRALDLALRALNLFEVSANEKPNLEFVMCLHVVAALYCRLGRFIDAIPLLEKSIDIPMMDLGQNHSLAKFAGCMQLGDTYAMTGQIENSILFYMAGLEIQRQVLGEKDPRFGETCRYVAEAHVQGLQFDDAEKLCQMALDIHKDNATPTSPEEAADRRLLGLICDSKGDHEAALEHYVLASMAMAANGQEADVAAVDCNIGDAYLSLARYDEAIFAYQKALTVFKSTKGDSHPTVASVYVRLADLHNKIGKFGECRTHCENALRIYNKPVPGSTPEEIASGLVDVSAIYESMNEPDQALKLLQKAIKVYGNAPGQKSTIAGIEAQIGVLFYILGSYSDSYNSLKSAILKFRSVGEKKNALFGMALNQMGLACVQLYLINEAADLFEEARNILEAECGPYHADTLGVYSNLAGTYDAMGRYYF